MKIMRLLGYKFLNQGKMMDDIKKNVKISDAYENNIGTYGRFNEAVKEIDPRLR